MTITREESELLDKLVELTLEESNVVSESMRETYNIAMLYGLKPAYDDRAARLEAALIRFLLESRP